MVGGVEMNEDLPNASGSGFVKVAEGSDEYVLVQHKFYMSLGSLVPHCSLVDLRRVSHATPAGKARWLAFQQRMKAMAQKRGGSPNDKFAWCEVSKDKIAQVVNDGFDVSGVLPEDGGYFGMGLYLSPEPLAINSVMSSAADENGLRHVLLCRVILGETEQVVPGSGQCGPSSEKFDSAVDNSKSPARYVVWYPDVNRHVLPLYVLSVKVNFRRKVLRREPVSRPTSPWISISNLIAMLSKCLPRSTMCQIRKLHTELMEKKISRQQLVFHIRQITGDKILLSAIKSFQTKKRAAAAIHRGIGVPEKVMIAKK